MATAKNTLERLNKDKLVDKVMELEIRVETLSSQPLSPALLVKKRLELSRKAIEVQQFSTQAQRQHAERMEEIKNNHKLELAKLEAESNKEQQERIAALVAEFEQVKEEILKAESALDEEYESKAAEVKEKIDILEQSVLTAEKQHKENIASQQEKYKLACDELQDNLNEFKQKMLREREEAEYTHKIQVRDNALSTAQTIAEKHDHAVVSTKELTELTADKALKKEELDALIEKKVKLKANALHAEYGGKLSKLQHEYDLYKAKADSSNGYLKEEIDQLRARNQELSEQVANIPVVIREAVAAAKADISVTNENAKK